MRPPHVVAMGDLAFSVMRMSRRVVAFNDSYSQCYTAPLKSDAFTALENE
jgi:hypothetical protein